MRTFLGYTVPHAGTPPVLVYSATAFVLIDGDSRDELDSGSLTFGWSAGTRK